MIRKLLFCVVLFCGALNIGLIAQNNTSNLSEVERLIESYRLDEAEQILSQQIRNLTRRRKSAEAEQECLERIDRIRSMMEATQQVVFVDSIVVEKKDFARHVLLSGETSSIQVIPGAAEVLDSSDSIREVVDFSACINQLKEKKVYTQRDASGQTFLYESLFLDGVWTQTRRLDELNVSRPAFPYLLSDGITLYFAAEGDESIGGLDIFVTRYDAESKEFLAPENVGMPFSSPSNDYLLAVDDYYRIGWLVTDRNQNNDSVCIYTFIPPTTHRVYNKDIYDSRMLSGLALINCIAETQTDANAVEEAKKRLDDIREEIENAQKAEGDFCFVVNDRVRYVALSEFRSQETQKMMRDLLNARQQLDLEKERLETLRLQYTKAGDNDDFKESLKEKIIALETDYRMKFTDVKDLTKALRNKESKLLGAGSK